MRCQGLLEEGYDRDRRRMGRDVSFIPNRPVNRQTERQTDRKLDSWARTPQTEILYSRLLDIPIPDTDTSPRSDSLLEPKKHGHGHGGTLKDKKPRCHGRVPNGLGGWARHGGLGKDDQARGLSGMVEPGMVEGCWDSRRQGGKLDGGQGACTCAALATRLSVSSSLRLVDELVLLRPPR